FCDDPRCRPAVTARQHHRSGRRGDRAGVPPRLHRRRGGGRPRGAYREPHTARQTVGESREGATRGTNPSALSRESPEAVLRSTRTAFSSSTPNMTCQHIAAVKLVPPTGKGCEECLKTGSEWVHLRVCLECGHVGCCDNSPGRHATAHFHHTQHPVMASFEPG